MKALKGSLFLRAGLPYRRVLGFVCSALLGLLILGSSGFPPRPLMLSGADKTQVILSGEPILESSPAAADLDGDGDQEIVVGGSDGMLYVVAYDGAGWDVVWSRQTADDLRAAGAPTVASCEFTKSDVRSAPAIADLDGDGYLEIVVSTGGNPGFHRNGGVLVYRYAGNAPWSFSSVSGWPQPRLDKVGGGGGGGVADGCWDGIWSTPALGDLDGDGDLEVVVEGLDRHLHAWHHDGSVVDGWPIYRYVDETDRVEGADCLLRGGWSSPALGDVDNDGLPEVVVGTDSPPWDCPGHWEQIDYRYTTVWAINGDSSHVPGWPVMAEENIMSSPALGDIDGDGQLEVVVGTGVSYGSTIPTAGHKVYAWEGDGRAVSHWPRLTDSSMQAPPALGDLDGDGDLEIVIGSGAREDVDASKLYAWHGDGSNVSGFPIAPPANDADSTPRDMPHSPVLADYDGDGQVEILITHLWSSGIATVGKSGASWVPQNDATLQTGFPLFGSPLVGDLDGDGYLEIAIGGGRDWRTGALTVWEVTGSAEDELPWPMFHGNVRRTGVSDSIWGRVTDVHGRPFAGVSVSIAPGGDTLTDENGFYQRHQSAGSYVVTPALGGYVFEPPQRAVVLPPSARNQDFVILPAPVSTTLSPGGGAALTYVDTQGLSTAVVFPAGAVLDTSTVILTPTLAVAEAGDVFAGHAFQLKVYVGGVEQPGFTFAQPFTVIIAYSELDLRLVSDESKLVLKRWTGSRWQDAACGDAPYVRDIEQNEVTVSLCDTGKFALFGPTHRAYMPLMLGRR